MVRYMYDSTVLNDIPSDAQMAAAYGVGTFAVNRTLFKERFPGNSGLLIDPVGIAPSACQIRDWETGDKSGNLEDWVIQCKADNAKPTVYCNRSTIAEVRNLTGSQVLGKDYWLWIATLDGTFATSYPDAPTGVVAVQAWGQLQLGIHADKSVVFDDSWYPLVPFTPPPELWQGVVVQENLVSYLVESSDSGQTWKRVK